MLDWFCDALCVGRLLFPTTVLQGIRHVLLAMSREVRWGECIRDRFEPVQPAALKDVSLVCVCCLPLPRFFSSLLA